MELPPDPWVGRCEKCGELHINGSTHESRILAAAKCGFCPGYVMPLSQAVQEAVLAAFLLGGWVAVEACVALER